MVGPINNFQQQLPVINATRPGISQERQETNNEVQREQTRPVGTSVSESQQSETRNTRSRDTEQSTSAAQALREDLSQRNNLSSDRGTTLDISV